MTSPQTNPEYPQERASDQDTTLRTEATETGAAGPEATQDQEERHGGKVLHMHTAHPRVPIPYVTPGDMFTGARAGARAATSFLPGPRKLAYYGLLGGMAVAGVLQWPVALAVGAATEVITREQQAARDRTEGDRAQDREPSADTPESATRPRQTAMT
ncbi:hypothetical protein ACWD26_03445 [Streptomyces sp. NPDC002787]